MFQLKHKTLIFLIFAIFLLSGCNTSLFNKRNSSESNITPNVSEPVQESSFEEQNSSKNSKSSESKVEDVKENQDTSLESIEEDLDTLEDSLELDVNFDDIEY